MISPVRLTGLLLILACGLRAESGSFTIHMILHAIGEETYEIWPSDGGLVLTTTNEISDRGNARTTRAELRMKKDYTAESLEVKGKPLVKAGAGFTIQGATSFAVQMA